MITTEQSVGVQGTDQLRPVLDAVLLIGSDLDVTATLQRITETAAQLVDAARGSLHVLDESKTSLVEVVTVGVGDDEPGTVGELPSSSSILGTLIKDSSPIRRPDPRDPTGTAEPSLLAVPILIRGEVLGSLSLGEKIGAKAFADLDEEIVVALAAGAGVAIENARLHARVAELAQSEDRDRIARDLHDTVIQRLFAVGLSLQGSVRLSADQMVVARLESAIDEVDVTVREIRTAIFELHPPRHPGRSARQAAIAICVEAAPTLGFEPAIHFDGPVDAAVGDGIAQHLLAVQREALSNVAKHASARTVDLTLETHGNTVSLTIEDDGVGLGEHDHRGDGLANMEARALELGGAFSIANRPGGGTVCRWSVPSS
ncbi:MAG: histidine kinase [Acidimicrobiia bacterium]